MAEKRMFTKKITESDAFLDMPLSAQCLYFHLNMSADDDGFVNAPKKIQRLIGAKDDDLKLLIMKSFLLVFENGVIVIKHWRMHNTIQHDRYHPTDYKEELNLLKQKDNKSYTWKQNGNKMETKCIQDGNRDIDLDIDIDLDKDLDKESISKDIPKKVEKKYFESLKVNTIFNEFLELRKKIKAVNSERAIKTLVNKLNNYDEDTQYKMIENSIVNSWKDVYELKEQKNKRKDSVLETLQRIYNE